MTIAITQSQLFQALGSFIQQLTGSTPVRGLDNSVPMPIGGFCVMTPIGGDRLSTNVVCNQPNATPNPTQTLKQSFKQVVQLDFYGPTAGDIAVLFTTAWRDASTCDYFTENWPGTIQPLDYSPPVQLGLVDGEKQYEQRWTVRANMQYNAVVTLTQQFFDGATVGIKEVDATYPP